jgi:hypothetical protein
MTNLYENKRNTGRKELVDIGLAHLHDGTNLILIDAKKNLVKSQPNPSWNSKDGISTIMAMEVEKVEPT